MLVCLLLILSHLRGSKAQTETPTSSPSPTPVGLIASATPAPEATFEVGPDGCPLATIYPDEVQPEYAFQCSRCLVATATPQDLISFPTVAIPTAGICRIYPAGVEVPSATPTPEGTPEDFLLTQTATPDLELGYCPAWPTPDWGTPDGPTSTPTLTPTTTPAPGLWLMRVDEYFNYTSGAGNGDITLGSAAPVVVPPGNAWLGYLALHVYASGSGGQERLRLANGTINAVDIENQRLSTIYQICNLRMTGTDLANSCTAARALAAGEIPVTPNGGVNGNISISSNPRSSGDTITYDIVHNRTGCGSCSALSGWMGVSHLVFDGIPFDPGPTSTPSPTPTITPTPYGGLATPDIPVYDCSVPFFKNDWVYRDDEPIAEFEVSLEVVETACYTVVPEIYFELPAIEILSFPGVTVEVEQIDLCVTFYRMPEVSILGIFFPVDLLALPLVGYLIRRLLTF